METVSIKINVSKKAISFSEFLATEYEGNDAFSAYENYIDSWKGKVYEDATIEVTKDVAEEIRIALWDFFEGGDDVISINGNDFFFFLVARNKKEAKRVSRNIVRSINKIIVDTVG